LGKETGTMRISDGFIGKLDSPPVWLMFFIVLAWAQSRFLPALDTGTAGFRVGWTLILAGIGLMAAAIREFRRHRTTIVPRNLPTAMITGGVYRFSRNPIYLADAVILTGTCFILDLGSLVLVPLFAGVILWRFILGEEAGLRATFGEAFTAYAGRVRRWL
jgi:protein-S-isoprenylcysteine O-methyltransferase Ste14